MNTCTDNAPGLKDRYRLMWRLQGKPGPLPSGLTEYDVQCLGLYPREMTYDQIQAMPPEHWRYLAAALEARRTA